MVFHSSGGLTVNEISGFRPGLGSQSVDLLAAKFNGTVIKLPLRSCK